MILKYRFYLQKFVWTRFGQKILALPSEIWLKSVRSQSIYSTLRSWTKTGPKTPTDISVCIFMSSFFLVRFFFSCAVISVYAFFVRFFHRTPNVLLLYLEILQITFFESHLIIPIFKSNLIKYNTRKLEAFNISFHGSLRYAPDCNL